MRRCKKCEGLMEKSIRAEHTEDLGGVVVKVLNAVQVFRCANCKSEIVAIPDSEGLQRAAAISRALNPVRLAGREVKYMRRVLDMKQTEFAEAMDLTAETVSRWENDAKGVGGVRHNVCGLLYKATRGRSYDPSIIARMRFVKLPEGETLPPIIMVRVRVQNAGPDSGDWGEQADAA